jgi:hypothetical protein
VSTDDKRLIALRIATAKARKEKQEKTGLSGLTVSITVNATLLLCAAVWGAWNLSLGLELYVLACLWFFLWQVAQAEELCDPFWETE